jgi:spore coat protein U-like protein
MPVTSFERRSMRRLLSWLVLLMSGLPAPVLAQTGGGALCTVMATPLAFGNYEGNRNSPLDVTATISVSCTPGAGQASASLSFTVALISSGPAGQRQLNAGREALRYELYADVGRSLVLGDGTGGTTTLNGGGIATHLAPLRQNFTVHGRILARQRRAPAAAYADIMSLRLNW